MATQYIQVRSGTSWIQKTPNAGGIQIDSADSYRLKYNQNGTIAALASTEGTGYDFNGASPTQSPISFTGVTLPASANVIRGIDVVPTRISGWTCFTGTLDTVSAYMDYREMHTAGTEIVYGSGLFAFMDSGASCAQMQAIQAIAEVDAGATILTAGGAPAIGIFAGWFKTLLNGETFDSGGRAAVLYLGFQPNVTSVVNEDTAIINMGTAAPINALFKVDCDSGVSQATHLFDASAAQSPFTTWGADAANCSGAPDLGIRCKVGASEYWLPLYINT